MGLQTKCSLQIDGLNQDEYLSSEMVKGDVVMECVIVTVEQVYSV